MYRLVSHPYDMFDEGNNQFYTSKKETVLEMEYTLKGLALWEMKYQKPWHQDKAIVEYKKRKKEELYTEEEIKYFIKCMTTNYSIEEIDDDIFKGFEQKDIEGFFKYLQDPQSAVKKIPEIKGGKKKDPIPFTSDRIYAWMVELQIPLSLETWNLNRLLNLIQIVNYDNTPNDKKKKTKPADVMKNWNEINDRRLKELGTKG